MEPTKRKINPWSDDEDPMDAPGELCKPTTEKKKKPKKIKACLQPGGRGTTFLCQPPEMVGEAIKRADTLHPKIICAAPTPGVYGGLTVYVKDRLRVTLNTLSGVSADGKCWTLILPRETRHTAVPVVPKGQNDEWSESERHSETCHIPQKQSIVIPKIILDDLNLTDEETACMPVLEWLYAFSGRTTDKTDVFLLLSVDVLFHLEFISESSKDKVSRLLKSISNLDKTGQNIRLYENAMPRMVGADSLPDLPGSFIYNPLEARRPAGNTVVAVCKDYILLALSNYTSPVARCMTRLIIRCFEYFLNRKAEQHAREVGVDQFEKEVAGPADAGMIGFIERRAIKFEKELLRTQNELGESRLETKRERLERVRADKRAAEEEEKRIEIEITLDDERDEHDKTRRQVRLTILDKQSLKDEFDHHLVINKPAQTMTHKGDNQPRVGCMILKAAAATRGEKSNLKNMGYTPADASLWGDKELADIGSEAALVITSHLSEKSSSNDHRMTLKECYQSATKGSSGGRSWESKRAVLTLLGGTNVINFRSVFREEMITFDGKHSVFAIPPGKLESVVATLKKRCEDGFAAGVCDGRVLFVNRPILESLPEEDRKCCEYIVRKLTEERY